MKENVKDFFGKIKSRYFSSDPYRTDGQNAPLARLYLILAILFGVLIIYTSPFFTPPDENAHFLNMCRISSLHIFPDTEDGVYGSYITADEAAFLNAYNGKYNGIDAEKVTYKDLYFQSAMEFKGDEIVFYPGGVVKLNPVGYTFSALGAWVTKTIFRDHSPYNEMLVGKLFNLIASALMICFAIRKTRLLPKTMFLLALMPMTIYQCASLSYDAPLIASCFLLFAYVSHLILSDAPVRRSDIVAIVLASFFIFGIKSAYIPVLLTLFAIRRTKFGSLRRYLSCIGMIALTGVVAFLLPTVLMRVATADCLPLATDTLIEQQRAYVTSHPFSLFGVFFRTVSESIGFWTGGFFGILGALDTNFWEPFVVVFYLILALTALGELSVVEGLGVRFRVFSFVAAAAMLVGTVCAMYIDWTPLVTGEIGGTVSTGTQGRYFIPVALFALAVLANPLFSRFCHNERWHTTSRRVVTLTSVTFLTLTVLTILLRYWI